MDRIESMGKLGEEELSVGLTKFFSNYALELYGTEILQQQ